MPHAKKMETVYITRQFDHSPEKVFRALTTPEYLTGWFGPPNTRTRKALVDLRPGGKYVLELVPTSKNGLPFNIEGVYQNIKNPDKLVFTLNYVGLPGQAGHRLNNALDAL